MAEHNDDAGEVPEQEVIAHHGDKVRAFTIENSDE